MILLTYQIRLILLQTQYDYNNKLKEISLLQIEFR